MAIKAKIFISSAEQTELKDLRDEIFSLLKQLGHEPLMYEKNFGPWPTYDKDTIQHCLDMVDASDIFLLFVYNKAGNYLESEKKTVTHLEFLQAYEKRKLILVFVEGKTRQTFFSKIHPPLTKMINEYQEKEGSYPAIDTLVGFTREIIDSDVDSYIWVFLNDIIEKNIYCEPFSISVSVEVQLKDYLSDMFRRGSSLIPRKEDFKEYSNRILIYEDFEDLVNTVVNNIEVRSVKDWRIFLAILRDKLKGGVIYKETGKYVKTALGRVKNCSGITLYRRKNDQMVLVEKDGLAGGEKSYPLNDSSSFVVDTYKKDYQQFLFYRHDKKIFYVTSRIGEFVISLHFPYDGSWNEQKINSFQDTILNGIINMQGNALNLKFAKLVLGGLA